MNLTVPATLELPVIHLAQTGCRHGTSTVQQGVCKKHIPRHMRSCTSTCTHTHIHACSHTHTHTHTHLKAVRRGSSGPLSSNPAGRTVPLAQCKAKPRVAGPLVMGSKLADQRQPKTIWGDCMQRQGLPLFDAGFPGHLTSVKSGDKTCSGELH